MEPTLRLSDEETARFHEDGFLTLSAISSPGEVERLREVFDRLFSERAGWKRGRQWDLAGTDEEGAPLKLPQISNPVEFATELRETCFRANALTIARQLLGPDAEPWFEHAILKPAHYGAATPWHQDEAHRDDIGTRYEQLSIWMPLQEATGANGCMQFIAGTHRGPILEHQSPGHDPRITALECVGEFDQRSARICPLPAGGATVHHCRTLHYAGPNASSVPRFAYILVFRGPVQPDPTFTGYPWNLAKRTAAQQRAEQWEGRGGVMGRTIRRARVWMRRGVNNMQCILKTMSSGR